MDTVSYAGELFISFIGGVGSSFLLNLLRDRPIPAPPKEPEARWIVLSPRCHLLLRNSQPLARVEQDDQGLWFAVWYSIPYPYAVQSATVARLIVERILIPTDLP